MSTVLYCPLPYPDQDGKVQCCDSCFADWEYDYSFYGPYEHEFVHGGTTCLIFPCCMCADFWDRCNEDEKARIVEKMLECAGS